MHEAEEIFGEGKPLSKRRKQAYELFDLGLSKEAVRAEVGVTRQWVDVVARDYRNREIARLGLARLGPGYRPILDAVLRHGWRMGRLHLLELARAAVEAEKKMERGEADEIRVNEAFLRIQEEDAPLAREILELMTPWVLDEDEDEA